MTFTQLDIYRNGGSIFFHQDDVGMGDMTVEITADMVDLVCNELQKLKKQAFITASQGDDENGK